MTSAVAVDWALLLYHRWDLTCGWDPLSLVELQKCHHNSISITQKHPKVVFSFANLSLKNQRIE